MKYAKKEVWVVSVQSSKYEGENMKLYVYARSASEAEKRALQIAKEGGDHDSYKKCYVCAAEFAHYVQ